MTQKSTDETIIIRMPNENILPQTRDAINKMLKRGMILGEAKVDDKFDRAYLQLIFQRTGGTLLTKLGLNILLPKFAEIYDFDLENKTDTSFASGAASFKLFLEDYMEDPDNFLEKWKHVRSSEGSK